MRAALLPHATLLAPPYAADGAAVERLRGAVKRQTYAYALPYAYLLSPLELRTLAAKKTAAPAAPVASAAAPAVAAAVAEAEAEAGADAGAEAGAEADAEAEAVVEAGVWLSNAPHGCWTKPDLTPVVSEQGVDGARELLAGFGFAPRALLVPACGGFVEATLADAAEAHACVRALHGQAWLPLTLPQPPRGSLRGCKL